jgi:indolepyruvate ferredoxin oxidoreductase
VRAAEEKLAPGSTLLTEAVALNAFRLMAYKDEYEVARLLTDATFWQELERRFDGGSFKLHLAPPILFGRDPATGRPRKRAFSAKALLPALRLLARLKALRGSVFDPFGWMAERKTERRLRDEYLATVGDILTRMDASNLDAAVDLASSPEEIRGYGPVKDASIARIEAKTILLRSRFVEGSSRELITAA